MKPTKHTAGQIVHKIRGIEQLFPQGEAVTDIQGVIEMTQPP